MRYVFLTNCCKLPWSLLFFEQCPAFCLPDVVYSVVACGIQCEGKRLPFPQESAGVRAHAGLTFPFCVWRSGKIPTLPQNVYCFGETKHRPGPVLDHEGAVTMVETQPASQTVGFLEQRCPWVPHRHCTWAIAWSSHTHLVETSGDSSLSTGEGTLALQPSVLMFLLCLLGQTPGRTAPSRGRVTRPQLYRCLTIQLHMELLWVCGSLMWREESLVGCIAFLGTSVSQSPPRADDCLPYRFIFKKVLSRH